VSNPSLGAVFESLPGASFAVNSAVVPANSALATADAELHLSANWSAIRGAAPPRQLVMGATDLLAPHFCSF